MTTTPSSQPEESIITPVIKSLRTIADLRDVTPEQAEKIDLHKLNTMIYSEVQKLLPGELSVGRHIFYGDRNNAELVSLMGPNTKNDNGDTHGLRIFFHTIASGNSSGEGSDGIGTIQEKPHKIVTLQYSSWGDMHIGMSSWDCTFGRRKDTTIYPESGHVVTHVNSHGCGYYKQKITPEMLSDIATVYEYAKANLIANITSTVQGKIERGEDIVKIQKILQDLTGNPPVLETQKEDAKKIAALEKELATEE